MACSNDCCTLDPINNEDILIKCPNFILCKSYESQEILDENNGLCIYCCVMNGQLEFKEDVKCIICLENNKIGVCFNVSCEHNICVECYKKKYLVDDGDDNNIFKVCCLCPQTQTSNQDSPPK